MSNGIKGNKDKKKWPKRLAGVLAALALAVAAAAVAVPVAAASTSGGNGFTVANVISSIRMFYGCGVLEGQDGTAYSGNMVDATGAVVDKEGQAGYLSVKEECVFAVYYSDGSLVFYDRLINDVKAGGTYDSKTVVAVYTGFDTETYTSTTYTTALPWYEYRESVTSVLFADAISPVSISYWFYGMTNCESMDLTNLDTSSVEKMQYVFYNCSSLASLDVSGFDTAKVTDMQGMFYGCSGLSSLDVGGFDTSNVQSLAYTFYNCSGISKLDLRAWSVANVGSLSGTFYGCSSLKTLDVCAWDTGKVSNASYAFCNCTSLATLDLGMWDTDSISNTVRMFYGCSALETIYVSADTWDVSSAASSDSMFTSCTSLTGGAGTVYSSGNVTKAYAIIDGTDGNPGYLTEKTAFAIYTSSGVLAFYGPEKRIMSEGESYTNVNMPSGYVVTVYTDFEDASYNSSLPAPWNDYASKIGYVVSSSSTKSIKPTSMAYWFYGFTNCRSISLSGFDLTEVTSMAYTFANCSYSSSFSISLGSSTTPSLENVESMFQGCSGLKTIDLSNFDTSSVTNCGGMFAGCTKLTTITVGSGWDLSSIASTSMFLNCTSLVGGNGTVCDGMYNISSAYAVVDTDDTPGYLTAAE